jgi:hypothetical protein
VCDCDKHRDSSRSSRDGGAAEQIQSEFESTGRKIYLQRINSAARYALAQMPELEDIDKLSGPPRLFVERSSALVTEGLEAPSWSDLELATHAGELGWWRLAASVVAVAMQRNNGGGVTPATNCENQYEQCLLEHNCTDHSWVCICCMPCSYQYVRCMAGMVVGAGGFGFIA